MAEIPTPAFAVPYAAPKQVKMMAEAQPIALKKGCYFRQFRMYRWKTVIKPKERVEDYFKPVEVVVRTDTYGVDRAGFKDDISM